MFYSVVDTFREKKIREKSYEASNNNNNKRLPQNRLIPHQFSMDQINGVWPVCVRALTEAQWQRSYLKDLAHVSQAISFVGLPIVGITITTKVCYVPRSTATTKRRAAGLFFVKKKW